MNSWPNKLPSPLIDGYERSFLNNKKTFKSETGKSKPVLFYTNVPEEMNMSFIMSEAQRDEFFDFYKNTLRWGSQRFTMEDPYFPNILEVLIISTPKMTPAGDGKKVKVKMEVEAYVQG